MSARVAPGTTGPTREGDTAARGPVNVVAFSRFGTCRDQTSKTAAQISRARRAN